MRKVDKSSSRTVQFILLCWIWIMANAVSWSAEHSSVGVYSPRVTISGPDQGKIAYFLVYVLVGEIGKKLDNGYKCPVYCEVNHKHIYRKNEADIKQIINKKEDSLLFRPTITTSRK